MKSVTFLVTALAIIGATVGCGGSDTPEPAFATGEQQQTKGSEGQAITKVPVTDPSTALIEEIDELTTALAGTKEALAQMTLDRDSESKQLTQALGLQAEFVQKLEATSQELDDSLVNLEAGSQELDAARLELSSSQTEFGAIKTLYEMALLDLDRAEQEIQMVVGSLEATAAELSEASNNLNQVQAKFDGLQASENETSMYLAVATSYLEWVYVKLLPSAYTDSSVAVSSITAAADATGNSQLILAWNDVLVPPTAFSNSAELAKPESTDAERPWGWNKG